MAKLMASMLAKAGGYPPLSHQELTLVHSVVQLSRHFPDHHNGPPSQGDSWVLRHDVGQFEGISVSSQLHQRTGVWSEWAG